MNEQIKKSTLIETKIVSDLQQDRRVSEAVKQDVFSSFARTEQDEQLLNMQRVAIKVQNEDALLHGSEPIYIDNEEIYQEKQTQRVHQQAQDEYAGMSWSQKRKLNKKQEKNLMQARTAGVQNATKLTLSMAVAKSESEFSWDGQLQSITQQQREAMREKRPDASLFDKHYSQGSDLPYDIPALTTRLKELELVKTDADEYFQRVAQDGTAADWQLETKFRAQDKLRISLGRAVEALYLANAVNLRRADYLTEEELAMDKNKLLEACVSEYQKNAENYDVVVYDCKTELSEHYLQKELEAAPKNAEEQRTFGFTFERHPAEIDALRQLMDSPQNSELVTKNKEQIASMWREYIRVSRTIDEKQTENRLMQEKGAESFLELKNANSSMIFRFEGLRDAYAAILRHFITGEELDTYTDALMPTMVQKLGRTYTDHRLQTEKLYPGSAANEHSEGVRKCLVDRMVKLNQSTVKYLFSLPEEQVNSAMDVRIVAGLCDGWKTDLNGEPLTEEDRAVMQRETKWVRDLYGKDAAARHAVIDEEIAHYINTDLPATLLNDEFILSDPIEVEKFKQRYLLLDNFKTGDPEYFESLAPEIKAKIDFMSDFAVKFAIFLNYNQMRLTAVDDKLQYIDEGNMQYSEMMTDTFKAELKDKRVNLKRDMRLAVFDATTDTFTLEEEPERRRTLRLLDSPRFLTKLQNRTKKGLPCNDLGDIFEMLGGKTLAEYYESILHPQYSEEEIEEMRNIGFGGRSISIDGLDFGTDDMARCADTIKLLSKGGDFALEYGLDEAAAQELKNYYDLFREESLNNAVLKQQYEYLGPFNDNFPIALKTLKGHESEYPQLVASMSHYRDLATTKLDELLNSVMASDRELNGDLFTSIISVLEKHGVSFEKEHRAPLGAYMDDHSTDPVPENMVSFAVNGVELRLFGDEGELPQISDEQLEQKRSQLGEGFGPWASELAQLVDTANAQFIKSAKYFDLSSRYLVSSSKAFSAETNRQEQERKRAVLDPQSPEYAELTQKIEQNRQIEEAEHHSMADIPVFNQVRHKITTLQYELLMKDTACHRNYELILEKIAQHLA